MLVFIFYHMVEPKGLNLYPIMCHNGRVPLLLLFLYIFDIYYLYMSLSALHNTLVTIIWVTYLPSYKYTPTYIHTTHLHTHFTLAIGVLIGEPVHFSWVAIPNIHTDVGRCVSVAQKYTLTGSTVYYWTVPARSLYNK